MKYCMNCGSRLEDDAKYCLNCGTEQKDAGTNTESLERANVREQKRDYTNDLDKVKDSAKVLAKEVASATQSIASNVGKKVQEKRDEAKASVDEAVKKQQEESQASRKTSYIGDNIMSSDELWSWLKKDAKRQQFYSENTCELEEAEFMELVSEKMQSNNVPAKIEQKNILWDRSEVADVIYCIKPETNVVNPITCLLQFNHVGKFTFVEEKTFITPPNLPEVPMKPLTINEKILKRQGMLLLGILLILIGLLCFFARSTEEGFVFLLAGGVISYIGFGARTAIKAIKEHNQKCQQQEEAWAAAWVNWQDSIFLHSFQEDINGQLSRIFDSVFECIKQVSAEQFNRKATAEEDNRTNMNELEQLIARRKDDYR